MTAPLVTEVRITAALRRDRDTGLMAYVSCVVGGHFLLDGLTVRRTLGGEYRLSFPSRRDSRGLEHPYYRPATAAAERAIEDAVLGALIEAQEADA